MLGNEKDEQKIVSDNENQQENGVNHFTSYEHHSSTIFLNYIPQLYSSTVLKCFGN